MRSLEQCLDMFRTGPTPDDMYAAICNLKKIGQPAINPLLAILSDVTEHPGCRVRAADALVMIGSVEAVPALITALTAPNIQLRFAVATNLGKLKDTRAIPELQRVARENDGEFPMPPFTFRVRDAAAKAIKAIKNEQ
jgi:HEAT repeat protein